MKILNQIYITTLLLLTSSMLMAEVRYLHTDMMGSVISVSDEQGNIISRNHYDPFGSRIGGEKEGIGYTGHLQDTDLGLTYMQARYYDPLIGRFYSNDPVGFNNVHNFNRYAYANNNPYKYMDPDGRETRLMVEAHHLDMDVLAANMTVGERIDISQAQFSGMVAGISVLRLSSIAITQLTKRAAQNAIIKKRTEGLRKQIARHKQKIKDERSLGIKPEMAGKTTKKQQNAQRKARRNKHKRDIKEWKKQIKQIEREVRSEKQ